MNIENAEHEELRRKDKKEEELNREGGGAEQR